MKRTLLGVVLVLLVFAGAVELALATNHPATAAGVPASSSTSAQRLDAIAATSVKAVGIFSSANQATLAFQLPGRVKDIKVKEDARVKAGDLLATLDTSMLETQVTQAQAALDTAQAKADQLKNPSPNDVAAAQANVAFAQAALAQLKTPTQNDVLMAKSDLDKAEAARSVAQSNYDRAGGSSNPMIGMLPQSLALQLASDDYQKAVAVYNARTSPTDTQLKQAQAALEQARDQLARLTSLSPNDLKTAQAAVTQAQAALDLAKENLANAQIVAPFDGTVLSINPHVGESVPAMAPVITLADLSQLQVKIGVDENTLAQIKLGQSATITADSLPGKTLTGKVSKIGMLATNTANLISLPVMLDVDSAGMAIPPGLSATVQINTGN